MQKHLNVLFISGKMYIGKGAFWYGLSKNVITKRTAAAKEG